MTHTSHTIPPIENEEALTVQMTTPSPEVVEGVSRLDGDIMILGTSGKIGPTLAELLVKAGARRVLGVDLFPNPGQRDVLESVGVHTLPCDLLNDRALRDLPDAPYILLLAGYKFGATGNEPLTWAVNTLLPAKVMQRFPNARIVYVSSGNVYRYVNVDGGGATEFDPVDPIGEYAQSRLGGERLVQFYSSRNSTPVAIVRLFYATELRYGIILDLALKIRNREPIDLTMGHVNQIWQGDVNAYLARSFPLCESPARIINLTGPDTLSVREMATQLGDLMGISPIFQGEESDAALLGNATEAIQLLGPPKATPSMMIQWVAWWVLHDGSTLNKPTKYASRDGRF